MIKTFNPETVLINNFKKNNLLKDEHLAILKALAYSDIFDYPLTYDELFHCVMEKKISKNDFDNFLFKDLMPTYVSSHKNFFVISSREQIVDKRIAKYYISEEKWKTAFTVSNFLSHIPFIKMICITGSLVFDNLKDKNDDIDLFIIVQRNHLWKTRSIIYALVHILNAFNIEICPNYIISDRFLELSDQNFYSARELIEMIPVYGEDMFKKFIMANTWAKKYYPNSVTKNQLKYQIIHHKSSHIKLLLERILSLKIFFYLEKFEMNRQIKGLKKISNPQSELAFTTDCCKSQIEGHGNWIKSKFIESLNNILK